MKVLNLVDHLQHGGVQRMAINIANSLQSFGIESHLCAINDTGDLKSLLSDSINYFPLAASSIYSTKAARRLHDYCKSSNIDIVHVHHRSLFLAFQSFFYDKNIILIWHDHYGRQGFRKRPWTVYYLLTRRVNGIISVSHPLMNWAIHSMKFPIDRAKFIPNFIEFPDILSHSSSANLPGEPGYRIVCVANFRPHKDHITLIRGFNKVVEKNPKAHLILAGRIEDFGYFHKVKMEIDRLSLSNNITNLGKRMDVFSILSSSDIGVLSSLSEGLPLTLIEYGIAGLPVVCTNVGDCGWLIKNDERGLLIEPGDPKQLATSLSVLLNNKRLAEFYGNNLNKYVNKNLNQKEIVHKIISFYEELS